MDQPTYTPTQKIVEATRTLFFKFGDLDATKPPDAPHGVSRGHHGDQEQSFASQTV